MKIGSHYSFKHEATAAFLLKQGLDPKHMNWHRFTLLHHMAADGELAKEKRTHRRYLTALLANGVEWTLDRHRGFSEGARRKAGHIVLDQLRTVDHERLRKRLGSVSPATLQTVLKVLGELFEI